LPGHGGSSKHVGRGDLAEFAQVLNGFIIQKLFANPKLIDRQLIENVLKYKRLDGVELALAPSMPLLRSAICIEPPLPAQRPLFLP
jgi:hypothetical protein